MKSLYELKAPQPLLKRYIQEEFPPYRFIPGLNAHPVRDEDGHSYGVEHVALTYTSPKEWKQNNSYLMGVDMYNFAFWWESHEKWEDLWHTTNKQGDHGQFLQGLIQISAAMIKWYSQHRDGMEKLFKIGIGRLKKVHQQNEQFMGLNLGSHITALEIHFSKQLEETEKWLDPLEGYPVITLQTS